MLKIFKGIYKNFSETNGDCEVFESTVHLNHTKSKLPRIYASDKNSYINLAMLIKIFSTYKRELRVLDFGGGAGETFFALSPTVYNNLDKLLYYIIDNSKVLSIGKKFLEKIDQHKKVELFWIPINSENLKLPKPLDILQLGSVLQYVENWKEILNQLFSIESDYIILDDIFAGNIPQYVTLQIYFDKKIPFQFLNIKDLISYIQNNSQYDIISISDYVPFIRGKEVFYDMTNFPEEYRLLRTKSLILKIIE